MPVQPNPKTKQNTTSPLPIARAASKAIATASNGDSAGAAKKPRAPKGPSLTWDSDRNLALFRAIKSGMTSKSALAHALQSDPAFDDVDPVAFTAAKIGSHINKLMEANKDNPKILAVLSTVQRERRGSAGGSLDIDLDAIDAMDAS